MIYLNIILLFVGFMVCAQNKEVYYIYNNSGEKIEYEKLIQACQNANIVIFGELHNNSICHWLELQILKDLYKIKQNKIIFGAEMFEADNQLILNELIQKQIPLNKFEEDARLWKNYKTDYKPLIEFCYEKNISVIGTNIPRRYAAKVARNGLKSLDSLSSEARKYIAPLPIKYDSTLDCYKNMSEMRMGGMHNTLFLAQAQAVKDATMAYFILKYLPSGWLFYHINGAYHSDNFQGIVWYLKQAKPDLNIITITTIETEDISKIDIEDCKKANFTIATPADFTKTY